MTLSRDSAGGPRALETLVDLLHERAAAQPDRRGYVFLSSSGDDVPLTYAELLGRARAVGAALQQQTEAGARVLLLFPPGLDFVAAFFGCLLGGAVAVPAYPPDPGRLARTLPRLRVIAADARVTCVLTTAAIRGLAGALHEMAPELSALRWISTDDLDPELAPRWRAPELSGDSTAFLQYTSGSTAEPRGVIVSHANVLHNSAAIHRLAAHTPESVYVCWLPSYHDMGLIGGIIQPLYGGLLGVLMSPVSFLQSPVRWLEALTRFRGTTTPFPNFALDLCVRRIGPAERARLDLGSLRVACNGAEPIRWESMERFAELFAPCGFRPEAYTPAYGLAEATLLVTCRRSADPVPALWLRRDALGAGRVEESAPGAVSALRVVGCGKGLPDQELIIVDPDGRRPCPPDRVGEIWVRGPSVAVGYWERPEETAECFGAWLEGGEGPFLRTGDLGFLRDGELFVTGRRKDLVIVRGRNLYPQDLERSVERCHPGIRPGCVAAFSVEIDGEERLALAAEVDTRRGPVDPDTLLAAMKEAIAGEHEVALSLAVLLEPGSIPKTSSGKLQRRACRAALLDGTLGVLHRFEAVRERVQAAERAQAAPAMHAAPLAGAGSAARADAAITAIRDLAASRYDGVLADERRSLPVEAVMELGRLGVLGLRAPQGAGGLALGTLDMLRVIEQLGAVDLTLATFVGMHNALGLGPVLCHARPALRDVLVPVLASGRGIAAFALSEPGAGSNVRALSAVAEPAGPGRWRLRGSKMWIGSAGWATSLNVFVRSPGTGGEPPGTHAFVVPSDAPGLRVGGELMTMGLRGMVQNEVLLDGVPVDEGGMLGAPGAAMDVAAESLNQGRLGIVAMCTGALKRAARLGLRYAQRRTVQSGRLLDAPLTLVRLADLTASIGALEALWRGVAQRIDEGRPVPDELYAVCKTAAPDVACDGIDGIIQLIGGRGYLEPDELPRMLRDVRVFRIGEGPTEALHLFLGSRLAHNGALYGFLRDDLDAADLATSLEEVAQVLSARKATPPGLRYALIGELASAATLHAVARRGAPPRSAAWTEARFAARRAAILGVRAGAADGLAASAVEAWVEATTAGVGDVEPAARGVAEPEEAEPGAAPGPEATPAEADASAIYDALPARFAKLDRRSTRYRYDIERDICWDRILEPGCHANDRVLASECVSLAALRERPEAVELMQWVLAVNICDRFIALEEALLRFSEQEREVLGATRSMEMFDLEERKHIETFRRYREHLCRLRPELVAEVDAYRRACEERLDAVLRRDSTRYASRAEFHYASWLLILFFEEHTVFIYRELLQDSAAVQPTWLSIHRAHAQEEAQHVLTDVAYLAAIRATEDERYAWSKRVFEWVVEDLSLLGEQAVRVCAPLYPEMRARPAAASSDTPVLFTLFQDRAFAETRAAAPYFAYVAQRGARAHPLPEPSDAASGTRAWIARWIANQVGCDPGAIDPRQPFPRYGLDSMRLIALSGDLARFSGRRLSPAVAYDHPTLELLAEHVMAAPEREPAPQPIMDRSGPLPLSARQERLFHLDRAHPGQVLDHITEVYRLSPVVPEALEPALAQLAARHEPLRTEIREGPEGPAQYVSPSLDRVPLARIAGAAPDEAAFDEEVRCLALAHDRAPFDLGRGPLWRAALVTGPSGLAALVLTMHHIVADGWSIELARRELSALYGAAIAGRSPSLPALPRQYADVAARERSFLRSDAGRALRAWWRERLGTHPRALAGAGAVGPAFAGAAASRRVPARVVERLSGIARNHGVSLYIALLTVFHQVLVRRGRDEDLLVGTHLFNRPTEDERAMIGYFVNVLTIRAQLGRDLAFPAALQRVHLAWMEALEHAVPVAEVVREVRHDLYAERYMPAAAAFNMLSLSLSAPEEPAGAGLVKRPDLAPPPGFMFFDQMLVASPGPEGQLVLTLWFNHEAVSPADAADLLAEMGARVERLTGAGEVPR